MHTMNKNSGNETLNFLTKEKHCVACRDALASAAHELVEQDAASRRELLHAQEQLQQQHHEQQSGLDQQGNLLPTSDFRGVYAALLEQWLGVDAASVIPDASTFQRPVLVN